MRASEALWAVQSKQDLGRREVRSCMSDVLDGRWTSTQASAWLASLATKGETAVELSGGLEALMERALPVEPRPECVDTCGTGGDRSDSFNASTAAALIAAAGGVSVAKMGNRASSSRCGSADLLEAAGLQTEIAPDDIDTWLDEEGFVFLFSPLYHPGVARLAGLRRELGVPTLLNRLGPLANPLRPARRVLGTSSANLMWAYADVLRAIGTERALIVRGHDGLDEVSPCASTSVLEVRGEQVTTYDVAPESLGYPMHTLSAIRGGDAAHNRRQFLDLLDGKRGPIRDFCVLNAGAAFVVADRVDQLIDGCRLAEEVLDDGRVSGLFDRLRSRSCEQTGEVLA